MNFRTDFTMIIKFNITKEDLKIPKIPSLECYTHLFFDCSSFPPSLTHLVIKVFFLLCEIIDYFIDHIFQNRIEQKKMISMTVFLDWLTIDVSNHPFKWSTIVFCWPQILIRLISRIDQIIAHAICNQSQ